MPEVVDRRPSPTPSRPPDARAGVLRAGGVVCFPTEGVPVHSGEWTDPEAVGRLRAGGTPLDVAVRGSAAARDWLRRWVWCRGDWPGGSGPAR